MSDKPNSTKTELPFQYGIPALIVAITIWILTIAGITNLLHDIDLTIACLRPSYIEERLQYLSLWIILAITARVLNYILPKIGYSEFNYSARITTVRLAVLVAVGYLLFHIFTATLTVIANCPDDGWVRFLFALIGLAITGGILYPFWPKIISSKDKTDSIAEESE